jgi:hypothetical protein
VSSGRLCHGEHLLQRKRCSARTRQERRSLNSAARNAEAFAQLVARARADGAVRGQVSVEDARIALMAITSFRALPAERASSAIRRLTDLLLTGVLNEERRVPGQAAAPRVAARPPRRLDATRYGCDLSDTPQAGDGP